jgi:hypothetical protein
MNRWLLAVFACLVLAGAGRAQVFFLDEFNGNDLGPHWSRPPARDWAYDVNGGQLNVTGLFYPSSPKSCCNQTVIATSFTGPPGDFRVTARMGWDPGTDQGIIVRLSGVQQEGLINFGYRAWGGHTPAVFAFNGFDTVQAAPPPPGMYEFTMERRGSLYQFTLDGASVGTLTSGTGQLGFIELEFWGPARAPLGAFHVDRIEVVPAPAGTSALALLICTGAQRRRRR